MMQHKFDYRRWWCFGAARQGMPYQNKYPNIYIYIYGYWISNAKVSKEEQPLYSMLRCKQAYGHAGAEFNSLLRLKFQEFKYVSYLWNKFLITAIQDSTFLLNFRIPWEV